MNDLKDFKKEAGRRIPQVEAELDDLDIEDIEGGTPNFAPFIEAVERYDNRKSRGSKLVIVQAVTVYTWPA